VEADDGTQSHNIPELMFTSEVKCKLTGSKTFSYHSLQQTKGASMADIMVIHEKRQETGADKAWKITNTRKAKGNRYCVRQRERRYSKRSELTTNPSEGRGRARTQRMEIHRGTSKLRSMT